jgi:hypothetical protein
MRARCQASQRLPAPGPAGRMTGPDRTARVEGAAEWEDAP